MILKFISFMLLITLSSCALDGMGNYTGTRPTTLVGYLSTAYTPLENTGTEEFITITYMFVIEDQKTMGVCAKPSNQQYVADLSKISISIELADQGASAGSTSPADTYALYTTNGNTPMALTETQCPYDSTSYFVGFIDMEGVTQLPYISVYFPTTGKVSIGFCQSPFYAEDSLR